MTMTIYEYSESIKPDLAAADREAKAVYHDKMATWYKKLAFIATTNGQTDRAFVFQRGVYRHEMYARCWR